MTTRSPLSAVALLAVALLLAGCSAGTSAKVTASATKVTLASAKGDPAEVATTSDAHVGDIIATNSKGRAQLDYPDGSLTRLGADTQLTVKTLDSASAQRTAVSVDVGQTWHRVKKLVADKAKYEVSTPVGVASVKGTAFEVDCTKDGAAACAITVIEGVVQFTTKDGTLYTIKAYQRLAVPNPDGGDPVVTAAPVDAMKADPFISANMTKDKVGEEVPAEAASIAGDWTVDFDYTSATGYIDHGGDHVTSTWTLGPTTCAITCTFDITSSGGATYVATLTETGFTAESAEDGTTCDADPPGAPTGYTQKISVEATQDGDTAFRGEAQFHYTYNTEYAGGCTTQPEDFDEVASLSAIRA